MNWKYCVTRKMKPNSAKNATVTEPLAAEKAGVRNSETSIIGCASAALDRDERDREDGGGGEAGQRDADPPAALGAPR